MEQHFKNQRTLSGPGHAGHTGKQAERNFGGHPFEVVFRGPHDRQQPLGLTLAARQADHVRASEILSRQRVEIPHDVIRRALGNNLAAVRSGARPHIQQMVRCHHGFRIVLDHHYRVAKVAQAQQGLEQAPIIPLMETDRRLIEDVEDADKTGADLCGQPDALAFPTGQRGGRPIQCQVIQTDVDEKTKPFANFFQNAMGDHQLAFREFHRTEEVERGSHGEMRHLRNRL